MKLLIIGKQGQVGSALVQCATDNAIDFLAMGRSELDITEESAVNHFFHQHHDFDFVINAVAYTRVDDAEDELAVATSVNCYAVKYLALACKHYGIPLLHISTDYIFDGEKITDYDENDLPNPKNNYGKTKLAGELVLKGIWEKHIILRVSWVFSEFGKNFVKTISTLCDNKEVLSVVCDQWGSPTSARSIAAVIIDIVRKIRIDKDSKKYWGVYHYSDFPVSNWHQLATYIAQLKEKKTGKYAEILPLEAKNYPLKATRPKNSMLSNRKIKKVFGIEQKLWMREVDRIIHVL